MEKNKDIKQVIVVRKDLKMRRGKEAAQVAHASLKVILDRMVINPLPVEHPYHSDSLYFTKQMKEWIKGTFTKVVLCCDSEEELFNLSDEADSLEIPNALILDLGLTEFKEECPNCEGSGNIELDTWSTPKMQCEQCGGTGKINKPTYTCIAIGPDYSDKIDKITCHLKLR